MLRDFLVRAILVVAAPIVSLGQGASRDDRWVRYAPAPNLPGAGQKIVLISGDEEYRSEEALPMLGKILARRHGFDCKVLFAIDPDGTINPGRTDNIPGLEALDGADLMILFTRFRDLPDDQMKHIVDYVESGRPIIGLRTATHAFNLKKHKKYASYDWQSKDPEGGFGRSVLGETWISHHGKHGVQSTRGVIAPEADHHPIVRGVQSASIWGPTDVYGVRLPLPGDSKAVILGYVLSGMSPTTSVVKSKQNDPPMPVAWTRTHKGRQGREARVFATTMGASQDLESEGLRRVLVNACYWTLRMEDKIPETSDVSLVGEYKPRRFGFGGYAKGVRPFDLALGDSE